MELINALQAFSSFDIHGGPTARLDFFGRHESVLRVLRQHKYAGVTEAYTAWCNATAEYVSESHITTKLAAIQAAIETN